MGSNSQGLQSSSYDYAGRLFRPPGNGIENNIPTARAPSDGADYYTYNKQQRFETEGKHDPDPSCTCGIKPNSTENPVEIIGGEEATPYEWPWVVALMKRGLKTMACGGTLIAKNWVVTAAHCVVNSKTGITDKAEALTILIKEHDVRDGATLDDIKNGRQELEAKKIIVHEEYVIKTKENDITLIMLKKSLDSTYMPACLAPKFEDYTGRVASLYGWGAIADTKLGKGCIRGASIQSWVSPVLRMTTQTIISNRECRKSAGLTYHCDPKTNTTVPLRRTYKEKIFDDMICGVNEGRGQCQGDSGGPFTVEENGKHILVGVTSWGLGCAKDGLPGVKSSIAIHREWIEEIIENNGGAEFCN